MTALSALGPIKLFGLLQRKSGTNLEAFRHHWRTAHKDEALKLERFMMAYVQNHRRPEDLPGLQNVADGAPEIWFRSFEDVVAMQTSDDYLQGAHIDEPNFMEGGAVGLMLSERVIVPGPVVSSTEDYVRVSVCLKRRGGVDKERFAHWLSKDETAIMKLSSAPIRQTRSISLALRDEPPVFEAVESYWWSDMEAFYAAWGAGAFTQDADAYIDASACAGLLTKEERVFWPDDGADYSA